MTHAEQLELEMKFAMLEAGVEVTIPNMARAFGAWQSLQDHMPRITAEQVVKLLWFQPHLN